MKTVTAQLSIGLFIVTVLLTGSACKAKRTDPKELPDLSRQARPFVTTENTKVRAGPGSQFRVIAEIPRDAKVQAVGKDGEWLLIVSKKGNPPGYVEIAAVKAGTEGKEQDYVIPTEGPHQVLADTQVRSGPGVHHKVVASVKKGTKINVVGEENGWLKVESKRGNPPGYVDKSVAQPQEGTDVQKKAR
jgi:uncharacterized protein YgiM (DUF1202 family)